MSFLKSIAGAFVEFDETTETPTQGGNVPQSAVKSSISSTSAPAVFTQTADPEMLASLDKTVLSKQTAYTALLEASGKLVSVIPDESTRIKAAFAMIEGARTLKSISDAIDIHVTDLEGEKMRFKQASDKQVTSRCMNLRNKALSAETNVKNATQQIETIRAEIDFRNQSIQTLTDQIANDSSAAISFKTEADSAEAEIRNVQSRFEQAVDVAKSNILAKKNDLARVLS